MSYESDESGRYEIYVRPFAPPGTASASDQPTEGARGQWQVSTAGGIHPHWRPGGQELYYLGPNGEMMAVSVTGNGTTFEAGTPVVLFPTRIYGGGIENGLGRQYDVARDGRFLINTALDDVAAPITLLLNWKPPAADVSGR